jgi:hypothetical protein
MEKVYIVQSRGARKLQGRNVSCSWIERIRSSHPFYNGRRTTRRARDHCYTRVLRQGRTIVYPFLKLNSQVIIHLCIRSWLDGPSNLAL